MAFLGGLLGGGDGADPLDIYGDLFTDKQKAALKQRELTQGLFRMSEALGKAAQPSPYKPSLGSMAGSLGAGLGAFGAGGDETMNKQLQAMQIAEKVRQSKQQRELAAKVIPFFWSVAGNVVQGTSAAPPAPGAIPLGPAPSAAPAPSAPSASAPPGAPSPPPPPPPVSMGLPAAGMSPFGLPGAAPAGPPTTGLPARIGMKGTGPNAVMIDLDTGQPIQSSPSGPITPPEEIGGGAAYQPGGRNWKPPVPVLGNTPPLKQSGLLSEPGGPPDQLVGQDGQPLTGQGLLASYTGGAPGGMPPFQPTPTSDATPGADGLDVVIPSGPRLQRSDLTNVAAPAGAAPSRDDPRGVVPYIRERATALGIDPDVAERVARSEGVRTFQSSVTQKSGRREPSWGAFQLYTGGGMGNDFQRDTGLDPSDPKNEKATIDYALKNVVRTGWTPWHGASGAGIGPRTGLPGGPSYAEGGQDTVIPSGRGIPASALTNVADTGAPGGGTPAASGQIPGLNMTPQQLGAFNALFEMSGLGDPFKSLLETYYKSPGYLGEKTRIEQQATKDVALQMDPKIAAETARQTQKYIQENEAYKSGLELARDLIGKGVYLDKTTNTMKPITNAAEAMAAIDAAKPTGDIKEYEYYRKQELAAGQIPDPFQKWDASRRKASATTINTAEGFDAAQTKARVGVDAKIAQDLAEQAITGRRLMPVLDELAYLADKTPEGWKGPLAITTGRTLAGFGITVPPGASNAEAFQALAQRLVPVVREPGATSQGEMNLYLNAGPSLAGTADGRRLIIDINRSMIQRSQEIAKVYRENIGKPDLYEKLAELDKPLFSTEQRAAMEGASKARAAAPAASAAPGAASTPAAGEPVAIGPKGERLVIRNGQWVPQ